MVLPSIHPCMDAPTAADFTCHPDFQNVSRPITALGCSWVILIIPPPCRQPDQMTALCKWQLPGSLPGDQGCVSVMERGHVVEKIYDMQKVAGHFFWHVLLTGGLFIICSNFQHIYTCITVNAWLGNEMFIHGHVLCIYDIPACNRCSCVNSSKPVLLSFLDNCGPQLFLPRSCIINLP